MSILEITVSKICPLISSGSDIVKCSGVNCVMYDSSLKTCRLIAIDNNLEIIARTMDRLQKIN